MGRQISDPFNQGLTPYGHGDSGISTVTYEETGPGYQRLVFIQGWSSYRDGHHTD